MEGARDTRLEEVLRRCCFKPHLQHNLYHTTLFTAFGAKGF